MPGSGESHRFDIVVIGGGPAGATAALCAARAGASVVVIERASHPRFHIGESFLPRLTTLLRELDLLDRVLKLPHVMKYGASFAMAQDEEPTDFWFDPGPRGEEAYAVNVERAPFDALLMQAARDSGAVVHENCAVESIDRLEEGCAELTTSIGPISGRGVIDASGQATVVGRHLGLRRTATDLRRIACFQHFHGVARRSGPVAGHPSIVMCDEGWFWLIPLDDERTSVGLVMDHAAARRCAVEPPRMLRWAIERTPFMRVRMASAVGPEMNEVCGDFSYVCEPFAGPGYFLVGDAATFVDPIFSTGVCLGMMSAVQAVEAMLAGQREPTVAAARRADYCRSIRSSSDVFFDLVRHYYDHGFREMFLNGTGPVGVHRAVLSALAGHVFPRPVFSVRWRLALFRTLRRLHRRVNLVPGRDGYSLLEARPTPRAQALNGHGLRTHNPVGS